MGIIRKDVLHNVFYVNTEHMLVNRGIIIISLLRST